ncbi:MAG TPA: helix-turn-helix domain-containing protein [Gemmatimonadales bacterium]|nr:helix-turn-helix domain-containing protein [Gemmatimonadales bacterium]
MATIWISVMEAATRLGKTHQTVRNWLASGKLKGTKLGGFQLVDAASVARKQTKTAARKERTRAR